MRPDVTRKAYDPLRETETRLLGLSNVLENAPYLFGMPTGYRGPISGNTKGSSNSSSSSSNSSSHSASRSS